MIVDIVCFVFLGLAGLWAIFKPSWLARLVFVGMIFWAVFVFKTLPDIVVVILLLIATWQVIAGLFSRGDN